MRLANVWNFGDSSRASVWPLRRRSCLEPPSWQGQRRRPGRFPWGPAHPKVMAIVDGYLETCGKLSHLKRLAALERFGLAEVSVPATNRISIRTLGGSLELASRSAGLEAKTCGGQLIPGGESAERRKRRISRRLNQFVDTADGWFIRYDNDMKLVREYRLNAKHYGRRYLEKEALPDDVQLGDRTFGQWRDACDQAFGRILSHMDFAAALVQKRPHGAFAQYPDYLCPER